MAKKKILAPRREMYKEISNWETTKSVGSNSVIVMHTVDKERETLIRLVGNISLERVSNDVTCYVAVYVNYGGGLALSDLSTNVRDRLASAILWHGVYHVSVGQEVVIVPFDVKGMRKLREDDVIEFVIHPSGGSGSVNLAMSGTSFFKLS